ncbi:MAG TPA: hypothetical protein VLG16_03810 [Candidatus Saccharimonadales bacterium]|nr:hypothetical protein [Candidatus Saccharimonadales bacterium]
MQKTPNNSKISAKAKLSQKPTGNAQAAELKTAKLKTSKPQSKALLYSSLILNGVFVVLAVAIMVAAHTRNFWVATKAFTVFQNTCPVNPATKVTNQKSGSISTTTYYVESKALQSGCANYLIQAAQLDNYRAHPDQAQADADALRKLVPDHMLNLTVVKSSENGTQLAPLQIQQ